MYIVQSYMNQVNPMNVYKFTSEVMFVTTYGIVMRFELCSLLRKVLILQ